MKVVQINTVCNESTGKIMKIIQERLNKEGFETLSIYGRRKGYDSLNCKKIGGFFSFWSHVAITTILDKHGYGSYFKTKQIIKEIKKQNPDIIHLHNVHGYYLNISLLFNFLKNEYKGRIFWTLHDCWTFTGHCSNFELEKCDKWKTQCYKCPNKKIYPISLIIDNSKNNYNKKKELFTNIPNLTIITPSNNMKSKVEQSFLKEYPAHTIYNGIDFDKFKYTYDEQIKQKYNIPNNKKILLGVASHWSKAKGLNEFIRLSKEIKNDQIIVLVGINKIQFKKLNKYSNIIPILRTDNVLDLAKLYSISNVFINPSIEETFSLVTIESLSCNTPVIVGKNTPMSEFINQENGILFEDKISVQNIEDALKLEHKKHNYLEKFKQQIFEDNIIKLYKNS